MIFLYSIVCEMYKFIIQIFHVKLFGSSSDISILEPITLLLSIYTRDANIRTNIKLSFLIQKRHNVLLNYMSSRTTHLIYFLLLYYLTNLL